MITTLLAAIVVFYIQSDLFAQTELPATQLPDVPQFYFDALNFSSDQSDSSRLDVYIEVPYEVLHFIKDDDVFRASYEVTIDLYDSSNNLANEKIWMEKIETKNYDESISPKAGNLSQRSFALAPGEYSAAVQVRDVETNKTVRLKRTVKVRNFSKDDIGVSDLMLVKKIGTESSKKTIYPNISGNVGELTEGFYLFFEIYDRTKVDSVGIWVYVRDLKGTVMESDSFNQRIAPGKTPTFVKVGTSHLSTGDYMIETQLVPLRLQLDGQHLEPVAVSSRPFMIRWKGLPVSMLELNQAIDQLQYITDKDKIDEMKDVPEEKKRELFQDFWKKKDPTPNTERNELMEEYYTRVDYANKHFSHYVEGWKTDMGMVYIVFGAPSNIERHPFDIDAKPYEVWTYYDVNREFVFIDATGFGDYKLQNPIWDIWRTRPH
jgi:GWxTD domain-containing protein